MNIVPFAIKNIMYWRDDISIEFAGQIYIRRLEGDEWAVGAQDEPEELFEDVSHAVERFLQQVKKWDNQQDE